MSEWIRIRVKDFYKDAVGEGSGKRTISRPRQKISQIISAATCLKPKRSSSQICVTG